MSLLLHPQTAIEYQRMVESPSHAIGIIGPQGAGKTFMAINLSASILDVEASKIHDMPYYLKISPTKGSIGIDDVRQITKFLKLKTAGIEALRRVVVIEHAGLMTQEAQNAILKLLEEPPIDTVIIVTLHNTRDVLPTILSRLQLLHVQPPLSSELSSQMKRNGYLEEKIQPALLMSGGLPGLAYGILNDEHTHEIVGGISQAKTFIGGDMFTRLVMIDEVVKNKQSIALVEGLIRIANSGLKTSCLRDADKSVIKRWSSMSEVSLRAKHQLTTNGQPKLVMTNLAVSIT